MGPRALLLTALLAAGLAAGCDTGGTGTPEPGPTTTTGSAVPTEDTCPPPAGLTARLETIMLRNSVRLPDGGRVTMAEWTGDSVVLEVVRATEGCPAEPARLELAEGGRATVRGVSIDVVTVTAPGAGGSVPSVQVRIGP